MKTGQLVHLSKTPKTKTLAQTLTETANSYLPFYAGSFFYLFFFFFFNDAFVLVTACPCGRQTVGLYVTPIWLLVALLTVSRPQEHGCDWLVAMRTCVLVLKWVVSGKPFGILFCTRPTALLSFRIWDQTVFFFCFFWVFCLLNAYMVFSDQST